MTELVFYTNPQSRGRIVRWMLEEVGVSYRTEVLAYGPPMKSEDYRAINPMGKVPAIVHDGKVVTECAAIIAYLADAFPEVGLAPPPAERHSYYRWFFFGAGPVEAAVTNKAMGFTVTEEQQAMAGYGNYESMIATLTKAVSASSFIAGESFSAADIYVGSQVGWGMQFGTLPALPEFQDYFARISERPARLRAHEMDEALAQRQEPAAEG